MCIVYIYEKMAGYICVWCIFMRNVQVIFVYGVYL